jgi:nitrogen regulatory protein P-II 2
MKLVTAIIKPFRFDAVREALSLLGVQGMTLTGVKECSHQKGDSEIYRGAEYVRFFLPKFLLEVAVNDEMLKEVVQAIADAAKTGQIGDGNIFVAPLEHVVRIRTGETGHDALTDRAGITRREPFDRRSQARQNVTGG